MSVATFRPKLNDSETQKLNGLHLQQPAVSSMFYYDLVKLGYHAMQQAISSNAWTEKQPMVTCEEFNGRNTPIRHFNLLNILKQIQNTSKPTISEWYFGMRNGDHKIVHYLEGSMLTFHAGPTTTNKTIGTWNNIPGRQRFEVIIYKSIVQYIICM